MKNILRAAVGCTVVALSATQVLAGDSGYSYELGKKFPAAMKAYQKLLPRSFKKLSWAYRLDGVGDPVQHQTIGTNDYLSVWSCKPHDCANNKLAILVRPDGKRAVVDISITNAQGNTADQLLGNPNPAEIALLKARLNP